MARKRLATLFDCFLDMLLFVLSLIVVVGVVFDVYIDVFRVSANRQRRVARSQSQGESENKIFNLY